MKTFLTSSLFTAGLISLSLSAPVSSVSADVYFQCQAGYAFSTKSGAARCVKPGGYTYRNLPRCVSVFIPLVNRSIGHFYKKNHKNREDMCVGVFKVGPVTNTNEVKITCPPGYRKQVTAQKDKCRKRTAKKVTFPNRPVNK